MKLNKLLTGICLLTAFAACDNYLDITPKGEAVLNTTDDYLGLLEEEMPTYTGSEFGYLANVVTYYDRSQLDGYSFPLISSSYFWDESVDRAQYMDDAAGESQLYNNCYARISRYNIIIDNIGNAEGPASDKRLATAQAKVMRAYNYFWLVNLYAKPYQPSSARTDLGVPIKIFPEVKDQRFRRNTVQEVYDQILADLQVAESSLNQSEPRKTIYRADSTAVNLLLSRVYLYMQRWEDASRYADKVLRAPHTQLENLNTTEEAFLRKDNPEVLFSMGGSDVTCTMCNSWKSFRVSHDLYQTYADEDLRKTQWWWTYEDFVGDIKPKMPYKATVETTSQEYYYYGYNWASKGALAEVSDRFLFRTAEAYLNKAEAEAYLGHDGIARDIINRLRINRYQTGSDYQLTESGDKLIEAIRDERRRELALEGHRWFDLRRYAVCAVHPQSKEIVHEYTLFESRNSTTMTERRRYVLKANDPAYTLPIPNEVLEFNTGMQNNEHPRRDYTLIPIH